MCEARASFSVDRLYWSRSLTYRIDKTRSSSSILWWRAKSWGSLISPLFTNVFSVSCSYSFNCLFSFFNALIFRYRLNLSSIVFDSRPLSKLALLFSKFSISCFIALINFSLFFIFYSKACTFSLLFTRDDITVFFLRASSEVSLFYITLRVARICWFSVCSCARFIPSYLMGLLTQAAYL